MSDFTDHATVLTLLSEAQKAEEDNRYNAREVTHFLKKRDGQWEPEIIGKMTGRPRYTFDKCNPVVDAIAGEMEQSDFAIKTRPAGDSANKDTAMLYDGLIRNIQSQSNAVDMVYNPAGRKMVESGFDAWMVAQDYIDSKSFEQDLFIRKISNAVDRVWFDPGAELQDMSDANFAIMFHAPTKREYEERWPDGSGQSVNDPKKTWVYYYKPDKIIIGQIFYKQATTIEIVQMSNGEVYEVDDDYQQVADDLLAKGISEKNRRTVKTHKVMSRLFDGKDWLNTAQETVFSYIPIVPIFGNFDISEDKVIYRGAIEKLMDSQRVYNYAQSRTVEEGALAPRGKYWMTRQQAASDKETLQTLNTNADPVQFYEHIDNQPPPFWQGGPQINQGLAQISEDMKGNVMEASGIFSANQGNAPNQSGYAIELQQNKGDTSTIKYFKAREIAMCHTARILVDAIPRVYDTERTVRILGEDGASKMEEINKKITDAETGEVVTLNDLSAGKYDVTVDVGPAFKNRQQETARAFIDIATIDPSIIQEGKDIWLSNLSAPGMDAMAERARKRLFEAGMIPDAQMTDEEKQKAMQIIADAEAEAQAAAAQGQQLTPIELSIVEQTQAQTADTQSRMSERLALISLKQQKQELDEAKFMQQVHSDQMKQIMESNRQIVEALNTQADTLKKINEAMGKPAVIGPGVAGAYGEQVEEIREAQEVQ